MAGDANVLPGMEFTARVGKAVGVRVVLLFRFMM